jgi:hypothetical protein
MRASVNWDLVIGLSNVVQDRSRCAHDGSNVSFEIPLIDAHHQPWLFRRERSDESSPIAVCFLTILSSAGAS